MLYILSIYLLFFSPFFKARSLYKRIHLEYKANKNNNIIKMQYFIYNSRKVWYNIYIAFTTLSLCIQACSIFFVSPSKPSANPASHINFYFNKIPPQISSPLHLPHLSLTLARKVRAFPLVFPLYQVSSHDGIILHQLKSSYQIWRWQGKLIESGGYSGLPRRPSRCVS